MKFFTFIFLLLFAQFIFCQDEPLQDKIYYEHIKEKVEISLKNENLKISHHISEKRKFTAELGENFTTDYVYNRSFTNLSDLKASFGIEQDEGKSFKKKVTDISEKSGFSRGVFYDDNIYFQIEFPKIPKDGYTLIEYELELLDPHFFKRFFFSSNYNCEKSEYEIQVDHEVELGWLILGEQKDEVEYEIIEGDNHNVHRWILKNAKANRYESNDAGTLHHSTHIIPFIKSYQTSKGKTVVLSKVQDLFDWYQSLLKKIKPMESLALKELTDKIIEEKNTDIEKAKAIFNWVQDNIRYVAFENGWRGFIPYPAQEICDKRYGDCKDMTHLMYTMMSYAGLEVSHGWVGTRSLPYTYELNFTPSVDNHLVIKLKISDSTYILDATNSYTPFGIPTSFILSKQILSKSKDGYSLYTVPEFTADDCIIENNITISEIQNSIQGVGVKNYESFEYSNLNNGFGNADNEKDKWMKAYLRLGANNFDLKKYEIKNSKSRDKGAIEYEFNLPNYIKTFKNSSFVNFNLTRPLANYQLKEDRINSMEIKFKKTLILNVKFAIPENYSVNEVPETIDEKFSVGSIKSEYTTLRDTVIYKRIITVDQLMIEQKQFDEWNNFIKVLQNVYNTSVEFKT